VVLFTYAAAGEETRPLATAWHAKSGERGRISVTWFERPASSSLRAAELNLVGLERLYEYLLQQDPTVLYEMHRFSLDAKGAATKAGPTQADVLSAIAAARQRAVADLAAAGSKLKPVAWGVVSIEIIEPAAGREPDPEVVSVRVRDARGRPVAGSTFTASRGAHTVCSAKLDADGLSSCKLIDAHGHAPGGDDDDDAAPLVVTFPGKVSAERIELPTTLLVERKPR
jgi:hypothetical protein